MAGLEEIQVRRFKSVKWDLILMLFLAGVIAAPFGLAVRWGYMPNWVAFPVMTAFIFFVAAPRMWKYLETPRE